MGKKLLRAVSYAASGAESVPLAGLPDFEPGGISYLDALWIDVNITDLDNGGGDTTSIDIYNALCASLTITDGTEPWGPSNVTGEILAESRYLAKRTLIPFQGNANGDQTVTAGTNATRRFAIVYDFRAYGGDPADFTPLCKALRNGEARIVFGALPTNTTSLTATLTFYAITHGEPEVRAVPRILTFASVIPSLTYDVGADGIFCQHFLRNAADWVATDVTAAVVSVGGVPWMGNVSPFGCDTTEVQGAANPLVAAALVQNHFSEPIGGTEPRALELLSFQPGAKLSRRPMGNGLHVELTGGETAGNITQVTTYARFLGPDGAARQFVAAGASDDVAQKLADGASGVAATKTKDGRPIRQPRLMGFLPVQLTDPSELGRIGLKF